MFQLRVLAVLFWSGCVLPGLCAAPLSGTYSAGESPDYLELNGDYGKLSAYVRGKEISAEGKVVVALEGSIPFLSIGAAGTRYLFLQSPDLVLLQDTIDGNCMFFTAKLGKSIESIQKPMIATASSYLVEGKEQYGPENLKKLTFSGNPFVPGRNDGWGNIRLHLEWDRTSVGAKNMLILGSGFVDIRRPYLYTQNSRAREIRVVVDGQDVYAFRLADTPNPQVLLFPKSFSKVDITFLSVFPGSKWDDLCLNVLWAGTADKDSIINGLYPE